MNIPRVKPCLNLVDNCLDERETFREDVEMFFLLFGQKNEFKQREIRSYKAKPT